LGKGMVTMRSYIQLRNTLIVALIASPALFGQYKLEQAAVPPEELAPAIREVLQTTGSKVVADNGSVFCEIWFRKTMPSGPASTEMGVSLKTLPHGTLLGAIRFPQQGQDRRGQPIPPGVYTLRYSLYPPDGNHQGVAAQRDFLLLVSAADEKDPASTPSYDDLVKMSGKSIKSPHPAVFGLWKDEAVHEPGLAKEGDTDWILHTKIGDTPIAVIVAGIYAG
jgi:hypothetical protein